MKLRRKALRSLPIALVLLALLLVPSAAFAASADHLVTQVSLAPLTPNILRLNQSVTIDFTYTTNEAEGVYIWARPMSGAVLTPNYAASPSILHPVGTGTASQFFTITSGNPTVTRIRFQMWNATQTVLLAETFVPVSYQFRSDSRIVSQIGLTATPNVLKHGQKVSLSFKYKATNPGGVRIFARPLTGSALTPHYAAHPSPLYPVGSGTGHAWFTVTSGTATVTKVRFQIWNANQTRKLFQAVVPVSYQYKTPANIVNSIKLVPANPNLLKFGERVNLTYRYTTNRAAGVRIWARPFSGGALTLNYAANPSPVYPVGSGVADGFFTITDVPATVDQIRIQMYDDSGSILLFERKIPVSYQFK